MGEGPPPPPSEQEGGGEKKKKVKAPTPEAPASVVAATCVTRAALCRVFGLEPLKSPGALQPTWVTAPGTGKLTLALDGSKRSPFPKDGHDLLMDAAEREAEALCGEKVEAVRCSRADVVRLCAEFKVEGPAGEGSERVTLIKVGASLFEESKPCAASAAGLKIVGRVGEGKKKPDTMVLLAGKKKTVSAKYEINEATALVEVCDVEDARPLIEAYASAYGPEASLPAYEAAVSEKEEDPERDDAKTVEGDAPKDERMVVDPFNVSGKIDYERLIRDFGTERIDAGLMERLRKLTKTGTLHRFLRRNIFFSHRDLSKICECCEKGTPFYLYTGRGPSSGAMHLGHLVPFMMTQWLQEAFEVPLVVQMTDDEKFLWKGKYDETTGDFDLDRFRHLTRENAKDIIACGFDVKRTFIFSDCDYVGTMYPVILRIWKSVTYNKARAAFGFVGESNIGQSAFPAIQAAPSFAAAFPVPLRNLFPDPEKTPLGMAPCLIPCAIDQDPYFRLTRDVAKKMVPAGHALDGKPALVHSKFFPPLQGSQGKMSSSDDNSAVFLTDAPDVIERKIKTHAFSGGRETAKEQRAKGADLDADVAFQWLTFFLEDDAELDAIRLQYGSGQGHYWNTSAVKAKLIQVLQDLVSQHQSRRDAITDAHIDAFFAVRPLDPPLRR